MHTHQHNSNEYNLFLNELQVWNIKMFSLSFNKGIQFDYQNAKASKGGYNKPTFPIKHKPLVL